jgi:gamma-glutamyl:cysteine ligase YbdK (ATP-grasp superfamily)
MGRCMEPLTVGYDWEMAILKKTGEHVKEKDSEALADEIRRKLPWAAPGTDLELIESRIGRVTSFSELLRKSERFDAELRRALAKRGWSLLRGGARPFEREPIGAHIHVGTFARWQDAARVQNGMARYVAPLAALMAASPVYRGRSGAYKSYRVASFAEWCSWPQPYVLPSLSQPSWGEDVCNKLAWGPTVELRVCDGCMSTRLMCETVALVAGLMWHVSERSEERMPSREDYDAIMENRWRAAKHGLQAVFVVDDEEVAADVLLTRMVELAEDGMRVLGASGRDLGLVRAMAAKRQTQSDFLLAVFEAERKDVHRLTRTMANIQRDTEAFEKYLKRAPSLPSVESDGCADEILESIGKETPYSTLLRGTPLSPARVDDVLAGYVDEGLLVEGRSELGVRVYTRSELSPEAASEA